MLFKNTKKITTYLKAMKNEIRNVFVPGLLILVFVCVNYQRVSACSTFKLQKGNELIYGHNLNEGDIGVPGMVFINKRGIFKKGRTWSELVNKDRSNPSSFCWISKYGSVTFNAFGRDFPDGGMNEAGLYIWEMNEDATYPKNDNLPKLNQMNWMQFVLDSYSTVDEAVRCASEVEIEGWGWHYFVGDARGNCVAIAFIDNKVVVNRDRTMPVPGLFNTPYKRELEILKYYRGFGGFYEPDLSDPTVPRFVKTAVMVRDYDSTQNAVDYGFKMLEKLTVYDVPEWSIIFDAQRKDVYFKTRINPRIKHFSMNKIDFSNNTDVLILNMDTAEGGDVFGRLHTYTNKKNRKFMESFLVSILPKDFFTRGGLSIAEYLDSFSTHSDAAALPESQFFKGVWQGKPKNAKDEGEVTVILKAKKDAIFGKISSSKKVDEWNEFEHMQLMGNKLTFTFRTNKKDLIEGKAVIEKDTMKMDLFGIEGDPGSFTLIKQVLRQP
jgi:choloylglycine hydrolase